MSEPAPLPDADGPPAVPRTVRDFLGERGFLARRMPSFEPRREQLELAEAVHAALQRRRHLVAEAGTGVGKSFAYLLPAILHADAHQGEGPIVVSTRTIALQEQLERKDLPFLHAVLPFEWSSVTAIGRSNYVCLRRLHLAEREGTLFDDPLRRAQLQTIVEWSLRTREGTRQDLPEPPLPEVWDEVMAEHGNCLHRACKHYDVCHWQRARRRMQTAQVLIVNHALYFADLALRMAGAAYLPPHRVVVFDEAHHLERTATESLGLRFSARLLQWHLRRLQGGRQRERGLLAAHGSAQARLLWEELRRQGDAFFAELDDRLGGAGEGRALGDESLPEPLSALLVGLAQEIAAAAVRIEDVEVRTELQARGNGLATLAAVVQTLCTGGARDVALVRWLEPSRGGAVLCGAPLDVSQALRQHLFGGDRTAILTSATLGPAADPGFRWLRGQLGIDTADTLRLGSPFDYGRQVELVLEDGMPDPGRDPAAFRHEAILRTSRHLLDNGGRALVLCTSWDFVRALAAALRPTLAEAGIELLVQGEAPLKSLLQHKRDVHRSVLLGTDSLWEGIDLRGEALTLVVVTRLPFQSPGHPLTRARLDAIAARGGDPFAEWSLPEAVLRFWQGFGRLIRSHQDHGKVVVLDPRARTRSYGRAFLDALPFARDADA